VLCHRLRSRAWKVPSSSSGGDSDSGGRGCKAELSEAPPFYYWPPSLGKLAKGRATAKPSKPESINGNKVARAVLD
jgi:hypothetical protein